MSKWKKNTAALALVASGLLVGPGAVATSAAPVSADQIVVATHRATEPCVKCSRWNVFCKLGNFLARCNSGH
jgi:hypothetical protein